VLQAANALDGAEWGQVADLGSFPPSPGIRRTLKACEGQLRGKGSSKTAMGHPAKKPMHIKEALQIVIELADQNALDPEHCDAELRDQAELQREAISIVEDMAVNQFGDD